MPLPSTRSWSSQASCQKCCRLDADEPARVDAVVTGVGRTKLRNGGIEGGPGALQAPRRQSQAFTGQPKFVQSFPRSPHFAALKDWGGIAFILQPAHAARFQRGLQPRLGKAEQRPRQDHWRLAGCPRQIERRQRRHGGKTVEATAARQAHQQGLGLIVRRVGGHQQVETGAAHVGCQQTVARGAGRRLHTAARFRAGPGQDRVPEFALLRPIAPPFRPRPATARAGRDRRSAHAPRWGFAASGPTTPPTRPSARCCRCHRRPQAPGRGNRARRQTTLRAHRRGLAALAQSWPFVRNGISSAAAARGLAPSGSSRRPDAPTREPRVF